MKTSLEMFPDEKGTGMKITDLTDDLQAEIKELADNPPKPISRAESEKVAGERIKKLLES